MKRPAILTSLAAAALLLTGCTAIAGATSDSGASPANSVTTGAQMTEFEGDLSPTEVLAANADYTTVNDDEWSAADAVDVTLSGSSAKSSGSGVSVDASTVTITKAGVYRLSGSLDGQVVVAAPEDALVVLLLDGAKITNSAGSAIEVQSADDVAIYLETGSKNSVSDASSYADDADANAAIYSKSDLTISGEGSLSVLGNDGINASELNTGRQDRETDTGERLEISGGTITIDAKFDGLDSNGTITITGGDLTITSADNGGDSPLDGNGEVTVTGATIIANGAAYDPATANRGGFGGGAGGGRGPGSGAEPGAGPGPGTMPPAQ